MWTLFKINFDVPNSLWKSSKVNINDDSQYVKFVQSVGYRRQKDVKVTTDAKQDVKFNDANKQQTNCDKFLLMLRKRYVQVVESFHQR